MQKESRTTTWTMMMSKRLKIQNCQRWTSLKGSSINSLFIAWMWTATSCTLKKPWNYIRLILFWCISTRLISRLCRVHLKVSGAGVIYTTKTLSLCNFWMTTRRITKTWYFLYRNSSVWESSGVMEATKRGFKSFTILFKITNKNA